MLSPAATICRGQTPGVLFELLKAAPGVAEDEADRERLQSSSSEHVGLPGAQRNTRRLSQGPDVPTRGAVP